MKATLEGRLCNVNPHPERQGTMVLHVEVQGKVSVEAKRTLDAYATVDLRVQLAVAEKLKINQKLKITIESED
jgi:hypothetical protein